jgi:hypothetical protein
LQIVVFRKAGEPGKVAVNTALVTHLRSGPGNFVDLYFGEVKVAVEGTFEDVVNRLSGSEIAKRERDPAKDWYSAVKI